MKKSELKQLIREVISEDNSVKNLKTEFLNQDSFKLQKKELATILDKIEEDFYKFAEGLGFEEGDQDVTYVAREMLLDFVSEYID